ncbi:MULTISPECIES: SigE family RNA polymerase sigma factor [Saccharothrix]|uniref:SigE family RNA polymerase sigma factor n=1 Tax=Saccharothrix yanglingensis TaxID=659496 RepID=A0ABU0X0F9_9PSEU|nr:MULTISPECIES: SigE family RNA polymerase sigma factor [Saccharothrix]MBY8852427.1 SigE family RNA polymerase sigma factor [Saccharothrix sp. MB29]MDQ2585615.1 SigE family RNA polymerase sigma factor [Saccharothrix yanglingensis]MDU0295164.1 SigE family RNA polymerase sigma factor [Saccharothrix longispora]
MSWDAEFTHHFDRCADSMRFTAFLLCGNHHEAEDLVQSAFLKLYLAGPGMAHREGLDAYLRQIVVRTFLAERRRVRWKREKLTGELPEVPAAGSLSEDKLVVWQALAAVPAKQRATLVLRYWHDLGVEETAAALGCTVGTVKSNTNRGLKALRQRLGREFGGLWEEVSRNA